MAPYDRNSGSNKTGQAALPHKNIQKELSDLVGLSDSQLCLIENGTNKLAEKRAANIGEALEVGVEWLLHGEERNKFFPVDHKMMEWLKDHPDVREQIWEMMEN